MHVPLLAEAFFVLQCNFKKGFNSDMNDKWRLTEHYSRDSLSLWSLFL